MKGQKQESLCVKIKTVEEVKECCVQKQNKTKEFTGYFQSLVLMLQHLWESRASTSIVVASEIKNPSP